MENALKKVIQADTFYQCPTKRTITSQFREESRISVLNKAINRLGDAIKSNTVSQVYSDMTACYKDSWFSYDYVREQTAKDDIAVFKRFVQFLDAEVVVEGYKKISIRTAKHEIFASVSFISLKDDKYYAYILRFKKADKSPKGMSLHTNSETDLVCMVAKAALEKEYPGIQIRLVFLTNEFDSMGNIGPFISCATKKSNIFTSDYSTYYDEHQGFSYGTFGEKIDSVVETRVDHNCFSCEHRVICQKNMLKSENLPVAQEENNPSNEFTMPNFTKSQLSVINHTEGAVLVCAGPGSGKTATIVGRIKKLIDNGVSPEFILAITFTKEAANELKKRCLSFCKSYELPEIMTLNALGYHILRLNPDYCGEVRLMTQRDRLSLINSLLEITPPLSGFNYSLVKGNNGLLAKVDKALRLYESGKGDFDESFILFADNFKASIDSHHFITYDQQISLAQRLFDEHPDILDAISSRYKYIMVDEFQDIDDAQAKFIYTLSKKYHNLCAVGDDDQSIYAFRGGTNKYMLHFRQLYPDAAIHTLKENFRSTECIISAASRQLKGNQRIEKEVIPLKLGGIEPIHIKGQSKEDVENVVLELVDKGFNYEDIAIIASKNNTLKTLQRNVAFPAILGRELLVENPFFIILNYALGLKYHTEDSSKYKVYLKELLSNDSIYRELVDIDTECLAMEYIDRFAKLLNLSDSAVLEAIYQIISIHHVLDCKSLFELVQYMTDYGDDTRIFPNNKGSVMFITSHESKGMEWKVVLMVDDYREEKSEEQSRLVYVAMTRASDLLYIFESDKRSSVAA